MCVWQINKEKKKEAQPLDSPLCTLIHKVCIFKDSCCIKSAFSSTFFKIKSYFLLQLHTRPPVNMTTFWNPLLWIQFSHISKSPRQYFHTYSQWVYWATIFFPSASCMWRSRITGCRHCSVHNLRWWPQASLFSAGGVRDCGWYLPRHYHYQSTLSVRWVLSTFPHMKHWCKSGTYFPPWFLLNLQFSCWNWMHILWNTLCRLLLFERIIKKHLQW